MKILFVENYEEMSKKAADIVKSLIILKPNSVLGLPTGDTPLGMYGELTGYYKRREIDFKDATVFNLDEYCNLTKENSQSYAYYMKHNFYKYVNIKGKNKHIPNGTAKDYNEECKNYECLIKNKGGIDLMVLGIGTDGHIGFNEPDDFFEAKTHLVKLNRKTILANSRFFHSIDEVPDTAISRGIRTIMQSRRLILLADGENKADAIAKAIKGKISPKVPASIIQLHNDATFILEKSAAKLL